jgi:cyclopropane-fatty-acyl-phospholipid synthase
MKSSGGGIVQPGGVMSKKTFEKWLSGAGVRINGKRPFDLQVLNDRCYERFMAEGTLGVGESYMDGDWECDRIDELVHRILRADLDQELLSWRLLLDTLKSKLFNRQAPSRAFRVGKHYDIGDDLYEKMLGPRMIYSCGYWKKAKSLDEAQEHKLELICQKIGLEKGMSLLDIGCGWGGFAEYAAKKYKAKVVGNTVSKNQFQRAKKRCRGLPVEIRLQDYRDLRGQFDRIVSIGMFEHVGHKNYRKYMEVAHQCLKVGGLFLLHTIGGNRSETCTDPWIEKYVFPQSMLPSIKQVGSSIEGLFIMEDWHNFGPDYDKTLMAWYANFHKHWNTLEKKYGQPFHRMWKFYLLSCAGAFRARKNQLWQILLSKGGARIRYLR